MAKPKVKSLSEHIYVCLLRLYPTPFRREYGREMLIVFRDQCRTAYRRGGKREFILMWIRALLDVTVNACGERLMMLRHPKTRNAFLLLVSGDVALLGSWIWLLWTLVFTTLILLDPWDFGIWVRPVGTLAGSISYFFGRTPGLLLPGVLVVLLQLWRLTRMWRASSSRGRVVWVFALTNVLCAFALLGVVAWGGRLTEMLFPHLFLDAPDAGYGRTALSILIATLFLSGLFAVQSRFALPRRIQQIPVR